MDNIMPPIPDFLLRKKQPVKKTEDVDPGIVQEIKKKKSLTAKYKMRLATEIVPYVEKGMNTFGKLRKSFKVHPDFHDVEDRELRSAIRYAMVNRIPVSRIIGKGKTRHLAIKYRMLAIEGKTYQVINL